MGSGGQRYIPSLYENRIRELAPGYDPRHVEAYMRIGHGTLDALSRSQFMQEVRIACGCIDEVGIEAAESCAISMGLQTRDVKGDPMKMTPSRIELHDRILGIVPDHDPVHVEAYFRLGHGPGSEAAMPDHQFERLIREAAERVTESGPEKAEQLALSGGYREEPDSQPPDTKPGNYYVTIRRDDRYQCLAGPFRDDHALALSLVDKASKLAIDNDSRASFDSFGTARFPYEYDKPGIFNQDLGLDEKGRPVVGGDEEESLSPGL